MLILDLMLPKVSGEEIIERLKDNQIDVYKRQRDRRAVRPRQDLLRLKLLPLVPPAVREREAAVRRMPLPALSSLL